MVQDALRKTRRRFFQMLAASAAAVEMTSAESKEADSPPPCPACYPSYDQELSWPVELDAARQQEIAPYSTRPYLVNRLHSLRPTHRFVPGKTDFKRWQRELRARLRIHLCLDKQVASPLESRVRGVEESGDCRVERILFQSEAGVWVPALFYFPKNYSKPGPVLLNCIGHGTGINDLLYAYTPEFVKRGFAVLAPETRDFGDRAFGRPRKMACDRTYKLAEMLGRTVAGLRLWDLLRAVDYLETRPEIDPKRIGCGGLSLGGELAMLLAALDPRIKVAFISGFLCTYESLMFRKNNCICYAIPGILELCDMADIAGLIAPRPCVIQSGTRDGAIPFESARQAFEQLQAIYQEAGAGGMVAQDVFDGRHEFHGEKTFEVFGRRL